MELGLTHFWSQAGAVNRSVTLILFLLSAGSWTIIAGKVIALWRAQRSHARAHNAFWNAESLLAPSVTKTTGVLASFAIAGANAAELHSQHAARGIGAGVSSSEFVPSALRNQIVESQAHISIHRCRRQGLCGGC